MQKLFNVPPAFWVMVKKETVDHIRSWKFMVLLSLVVLTCLGSLYTAIVSITQEASQVKVDDPAYAFFFLKLLTVSDGTLPPFHLFIGFLGPLLGIALGFDAINSEQNNRTLARVLAQPIHRDYVINAKFVSALAVIGILFFALGFLVMGMGLLVIGVPPSAEEFLRILCFLILSTLYVAFWLNLSIFFSIVFRQAATSALSVIAIWLFFTVFYPIILNVVAKAIMPSEMAPANEIMAFQETMFNLFRIVPSQLYTDATTTLLIPSVRSLGPLTMEQVHGAIPGVLPLGQSLMVVWPQLSGLVAATIGCFAISFYVFMKKEIRC